nr:RNA-directed DNA polymerase, eukaryota [Tanacetum cinerariifolium]
DSRSQELSGRLNISFRVKDIRAILDDMFLPSASEATRWVKYISIKINVFNWRARLNRLPTRCNLLNRGVVLESSLCPICGSVPEDAQHIFSVQVGQICASSDLSLVGYPLG